jgi:hypothetical protein
MRPVVGEEGEERAGGGGGMGRVARWVPGAEGSVAFGSNRLEGRSELIVFQIISRSDYSSCPISICLAYHDYRPQ